jgi:hypothetical protein
MAGRSVGSISVRVDADTGRMKVQLVRDTRQAARDAKRVADEELDDITARISNFETNRAALNAEKVRIDAAFGDITVNIVPDVSDAHLAAAQAKVAAGTDGGWGGAGGRAGTAAGDAFLDSFSNRTRLIAGAIALLAEPAAVALQGALSAATAITSSAFAAIAGGAGALTPILAGLGGEIAAIVVGSQGMVDALGAITDEFAAAVVEGREFDLMAADVQDALRPLGPAARDFATAFAEILPALSEVREAVSERLFAGLGDVLRDLSKTVIPDVEESLESAADVANAFFRDLADLAAETDFSAIFEALRPAMEAMGDAVIDVLGTIEPFLAAAAPAAELLADGLARGAESLRAMVEANPEALEDFLTAGVESLQRWWDLLSAIGDALFTVFAAGQSTGDDFLAGLTGIVERWDQWLEGAAGQTALADFFNNARRVVDDFGTVLDGVIEGFDRLVTEESFGRFTAITDAIGRVLPIIGDFLNTIGPLAVGTARAFETIAIALQPILDVIGAFPDEVLVAVGAFGTLTTALKGVDVGIRAVRVAADKLGQSVLFSGQWGLVLFGLSAAVGAAVAAWDHFAGKEAEVEAASRQLAASLGTAVEAMLESNDAALVASGGMDALAVSLTGADSEGAKFREALGALGVAITDADDVLVGMATNAEAMMTRLATGMGLPLDAARRLVDLVASSEQPFLGVGGRIDALARSTGIGREALVNIAKALEQVQDRAEEIDLDTTIRSFLNSSAAASTLNQSLLAQAEAATGLSRGGEDLLALYQAYTTLLGQADAKTEAAIALSDGLATALGQVADEAAIATPEIDGFAAASERLETALDDATAATDLFRGAMDLLVAPTLDAQAAADAYRQTVADLALAIKGGAEAERLREQAAEAANEANRLAAEGDAEGAEAARAKAEALRDEADALEAANRTLDANTEAGRANRESIRQNVEAMLSQASAALTDGEALGTVEQRLRTQRQALIDQVMQFGLTRAEARRYVNQLGLTPKTIETVINQPGMDDALAKTEQLDRDLDGIPDAVDTFVNVNVDDEPLIRLSETINALNGETIQIFTDVAGVRRFAAGGWTGPGLNVGGEAGAELVRFGSRTGLLTGPTLLPRGVHVTSASRTERLLGQLVAALGGRGPAPGGKQFNVVNHITPTQANPEMVAASVINRMAVLAR